MSIGEKGEQHGKARNLIQESPPLNVTPDSFLRGNHFCAGCFYDEMFIGQSE